VHDETGGPADETAAESGASDNKDEGLAAGKDAKTSSPEIGGLRQGSINTAKEQRGSKPSKRRKQALVTQTTLSLASKGSFTECKVCDILYNPLHEKDVRDHTRYHAKICRRKVCE